jgi:hypothetical protein
VSECSGVGVMRVSKYESYLWELHTLLSMQVHLHY